MMDSLHPKVALFSIRPMVTTFVNAKIQRLKLRVVALKQDS